MKLNFKQIREYTSLHQLIISLDVTHNLIPTTTYCSAIVTLL